MRKSSRPGRSAKTSESRGECLVLCPFSDGYDSLCSQTVFPAIATAGFRPLRADQLQSSRPILDLVTERIESCRAILADISEDNVNVGYEVGIAHTLGRPVVFISSVSPEMIPFYLKPYKIIHYRRTEPGWEAKLAREITQALGNLGPFAPNSNNPLLGLTHCFDGDNEAFFESIEREIARSESTIVLVGWGLAFLLAHRYDLLEKIARHVDTSPSLTVHVLLPRADHPGLLARIDEEAKVQTGFVLPNWHITFFEIAQDFSRMVNPANRERVTVERLSYLPTAMVVQIDSVFYFRPYGPPNRGGRHSPWLRILQESASPTWAAYLRNMVDFALLDVKSNKPV